MKTKLLNQLIADVSVALFHAEAKVSESFGVADEINDDDYLTAVRLKRLLACLSKAVHVNDKSYILDYALAGNIAACLNHVGYGFRMPSCEGILQLSMDVANLRLEGSKGFAQSFFLQMLTLPLTEQELAAAQAALNLLENEL